LDATAVPGAATAAPAASAALADRPGPRRLAAAGPLIGLLRPVGAPVIAPFVAWPAVLDVHVDLLLLLPRHLRLGIRLPGRGARGVGPRLALCAPGGVGDRLARGAGPRSADAVPVGEPPGDEAPL